MHSLKKRTLPQVVANEPRSRRVTLIRWVYIGTVLALAMWTANFLIGDRIFLRADGMVVGEQAVVAAEYPVTVRHIFLREGDLVHVGDNAAVVSSQTVAESIAKLSSDIAARMVRQGDLRIRRQVIDAMLPLAEKRQKVARNARQALESLLDRKYLGINQHTAALDGEYRGVQDYETLKSEKVAIDAELDVLAAVLAEAQKAITDLRELYNGGRLAAPIDGMVTRLAASKGAVVRSGEPIMELTGSRHFVLAQVPTGAFYHVRPGQEVTIKTGLKSNRGTIASVEPFASALPREFQRAFTPVERQQVIRVEFAPGETLPPLFSKVRIQSKSVLGAQLAHLF